MSVGELIRCGGVSRLERDAAAKAIAQERRFWLQMLEAGLTNAMAPRSPICRAT